jgi:hypothetical protein
MGKPPVDPSSLTERALRALDALDPGLSGLALVEELRRQLPAEEARAAAELCELRRRAQGRLADAPRLLLSRKGLEQASDRRVAAARAARLVRLAPGRLVLDATAGMGSDALALLARGVHVLAADRDPGAARCAAANLRALGGAVLRADALRPPLLRTEDALLLIDPDRRAGRARGEGRAGAPEEWEPPLEACLALERTFAGACLKLPPAFDAERLDLAPGRPLLVQWVSLAGELKEVALWTGVLAGEGAGRREALALDRAGAEARLAGEPLDCAALEDREARAAPFIADPDPALVRSGLLGLLAQELGAHPLHPLSAYLGSEKPLVSPFLRSFRVLDAAPLDPRRVRRMLGLHDVGPVTVKKRGHPDPADKLARRLRGPGRQPGVLLLARLERSHHAFLVAPLDPPHPR